MWIFLNDAFLSIVRKDCARDELLVRARRPGDIRTVFPDARVTIGCGTDYRYRAAIKMERVAEVMASEVRRISYDNFKDSVKDDDLHTAYLRVWTVMGTLQPGFGALPFDRPKPRKRQPRRKR